MTPYEAAATSLVLALGSCGVVYEDVLRPRISHGYLRSRRPCTPFLAGHYGDARTLQGTGFNYNVREQQGRDQGLYCEVWCHGTGSLRGRTDVKPPRSVAAPE